MKNLKKLLLLVAIIPGLTSCAKNNIDDKNIVVGATAVPHAEILKTIKSYIEDNGYKLTIKEFSEYTLLNPSVVDGSLDANFFQHLPFLEDYNTNNKTDLTGVFNVHFEPLSLYTGKGNKSNVNGSIAIPNDTSNGARALLLLADNGVIEINESKGLNVTVLDITNKKGNTIVELEASQIPNSLSDVDFAVINGNYALNAEISNDKIVFSEEATSSAASRYANLIACKKDNIDKPAIKLLVEAFNRDEVRQFILDSYDDKVIPVF